MGGGGGGEGEGGRKETKKISLPPVISTLLNLLHDCKLICHLHQLSQGSLRTCFNKQLPVVEEICKHLSCFSVPLCQLFYMSLKVLQNQHGSAFSFSPFGRRKKQRRKRQAGNRGLTLCLLCSWQWGWVCSNSLYTGSSVRTKETTAGG